VGNVTEVKVIINEVTELEALLKTNGKLVILVYATWCPFCMRFLPVFKKYAKDDGQFILAEDNNEIVAEKYDVDIVPTVLVFENGQIIKRLDGGAGIGLTESELSEFLQDCEIKSYS
jgi:thioredoxin 1